MKAVLGFDTSCYTTSVALADLEGEILSSSRRLLSVKPGSRGLQQSAALFQHITRLPEMVSLLERAPDVQICAVSASTRPRPVESSYMPVFRAGESQARTVAQLLNVPFYPFSHQEGHIRAALYRSGLPAGEPFLAVHLSGGTTEVVKVSREGIGLLFATSDLSAGQLLDRVGVRLGLSFPAGPEMETLARSFPHPRGVFGASLKGDHCSFSGIEAAAMRSIERGNMAPAELAGELFDAVARTVARMIGSCADETGCRRVLLAGGVASSLLFREMLESRRERYRIDVQLYYALPEYSGDNAAGIALLGSDRLADRSMG